IVFDIFRLLMVVTCPAVKEFPRSPPLDFPWSVERETAHPSQSRRPKGKDSRPPTRSVPRPLSEPVHARAVERVEGCFAPERNKGKGQSCIVPMHPLLL